MPTLFVSLLALLSVLIWNASADLKTVINVLFSIQIFIILFFLYNYTQSPICRSYFDGRLNQDSFQIKGTFIHMESLYMIVLDEQDFMHVVHQIPLKSIHLKDHLIYLDDSKPMTMKNKWNFEPIEKNLIVENVFYLSNFTYFDPKGENVVVMIYDNNVSDDDIIF